jgi:hypothetical protein
MSTEAGLKRRAMNYVDCALDTLLKKHCVKGDLESFQKKWGGGGGLLIEEIIE